MFVNIVPCSMLRTAHRMPLTCAFHRPHSAECGGAHSRTAADHRNLAAVGGLTWKCEQADWATNVQFTTRLRSQLRKPARAHSVASVEQCSTSDKAPSVRVHCTHNKTYNVRFRMSMLNIQCDSTNRASKTHLNSIILTSHMCFLMRRASHLRCVSDAFMIRF